MMISPNLQSAIAGQICEACSEGVTVRFNCTGTDQQTMLFQGANGRVIRGTCVDAMHGSDWPLWGCYRCLQVAGAKSVAPAGLMALLGTCPGTCGNSCEPLC